MTQILTRIKATFCRSKPVQRNPQEAPTIERPTCGTCAYWDARGLVGVCRRCIPVYDEDAGAVFPKTHTTDWCGQHPQFAEWLETQKKTDTTTND